MMVFSSDQATFDVDYLKAFNRAGNKTSDWSIVCLLAVGDIGETYTLKFSSMEERDEVYKQLQKMKGFGV